LSLLNPTIPVRIGSTQTGCLPPDFARKKTVDDAINEIIQKYKAGELKNEDHFHNLKWMQRGVVT
jgi:hypothetical protein